jgi:hypothetical protein
MESLSPFLWGSCIPYNMPVYPGARRITPYAWMWQLGSERIVGNSSTITSLIDLLPKTSGRRLTIRFLFANTD